MRYLYLNFTDTSLFMCPRYPTQLMLIMTLQVCVVIARPRAVLAPADPSLHSWLPSDRILW